MDANEREWNGGQNRKDSAGASSLQKLLDFLVALDRASIYYSLARPREEAIMVEIAVPGERWEVEFFADGHVEVEAFGNSAGMQARRRWSACFASTPTDRAQLDTMMARVIPDITRSDPGGGWSFLLRYSDLEPLFADAEADHLYLDVRFSRWRTFVDTPREDRPAGHEFPLLEAGLKPEPDHATASDPWYDDPTAPLVKVTVYAVPLAVARETGLRRTELRAELARRLQSIGRTRLVGDRWHVRAVLDPCDRCIRWRVLTWDGLRATEPRAICTPLAVSPPG